MLLTPRHIKASGTKTPAPNKDHVKKAKGGELYGHYAANRRLLDKSA